MDNVLPFCSADQSSKEQLIYSNDRYTLVPPKDFKRLPTMDWAVDGILPMAGIACYYGTSGVGKSYAASDLMLKLAHGERWFGRLTKKCSVTYVALEGQTGVRRRIYVSELHRGEAFPENVRFVFDRFSLLDKHDVSSLGDLVKRCGMADVVIIDTLNMAAPGADENASADMGRIIAGASALQAITGGLVILIHHSGKDESRGLRGHSSLRAALDAVIKIERNGDRCTWTLEKSKDSEDGISHSFNLIKIEVEDPETGETLTSRAIEEIGGISSVNRKKEPRGENQKLVLAAFTELLVEQRVQSAEDADTAINDIPLDEAIEKLRPCLQNSSPNHRQQRAKEAIDGLIKHGFLDLLDGRLSLTKSASTEENNSCNP